MYTFESICEFRKSRGKKKIILDSNLLLLLFIGGCDHRWLITCDCVKNYSAENYKLLLRILSLFDPEIIITPHILTEVSNFSKRDIKEPKIHHYISTVVSRLKNYKEEHISLESMLGINLKLLVRFGFTDMSIFEVSKKNNAVILSDDLGLCLLADSNSVPNIHFKRIIGAELLK